MSVVPAMSGLRGKVRLNEPMARHTSWRVGGPAERFYEPADLDDLVMFMKHLSPEEPLYCIGLGSNLLVRDGGVRGTVIGLSGMLSGLSVISEGVVRAEAGVASAKVARFSVNQDLAGAEFLAGIPGTVGGALAMNAGAFGGETWNIVQCVETLDRGGGLHIRTPAEYEVGYRSVKGPPDEWFVAGRFALAPGTAKQGKALIKSLLARRGASQPTQTANAGSVFKNPPGDHAARLIEVSGLKGVCEGGACVSDIHANFIVNTGGATAAEIERLIERIRREVEARQAVRLDSEVRVIGEAP